MAKVGEGEMEGRGPKVKRDDEAWKEANGGDSDGTKGRHRDGEQEPRPSPRPAEGKVSHIIQEIIETERSYVADLKAIIEGYENPSINQDIFHDQEEFMAVFGNIDEICELNSSLLGDLEVAQGDPVKIGNCFIKKEKAFHQYTLYCTNYPRSIAILTEYGQNKNPIFHFLKESQRRLGHLLPLGSYLLKPVQRILKYRLLLLDLVKSVDSTLAGYDTLQQALLTMTSVAKYINEMKKLHEATMRVQEIQSMLTEWKGDDLSFNGRLLQEAVLRVPGARDPRQAFLFEKMLLITKKREDGRFSYKAHFETKDMVLTEFLAGQECSFLVSQHTNSKNSVTLQCPSMESKQEWVIQLRKLVLDSLPDLPSKAREIVLGLTSGQHVGTLPYNYVTNRTPTHGDIAKASTLGRKKTPGVISSVAPSKKDRVRTLPKKSLTVDAPVSVERPSLRPPTPTRGKPRAQSLFEMSDAETSWREIAGDGDVSSLDHIPRRRGHVSRADLEKLRKSRAMEKFKIRKESGSKEEVAEKEETPSKEPVVHRRTSQTVSRKDRILAEKIKITKGLHPRAPRSATISTSPLPVKRPGRSPILKRRNSVARQSMRRRKASVEPSKSKSVEAFASATGKMAGRRESVYNMAGDLAGEVPETSPRKMGWDFESEQEQGWDIVIVDAIFRKYTVTASSGEVEMTEELWEEEPTFLNDLKVAMRSAKLQGDVPREVRIDVEESAAETGGESDHGMLSDDAEVMLRADKEETKSNRSVEWEEEHEEEETVVAEKDEGERVISMWIDGSFDYRSARITPEAEAVPKEASNQQERDSEEDRVEESREREEVSAEELARIDNLKSDGEDEECLPQNEENPVPSSPRQSNGEMAEEGKIRTDEEVFESREEEENPESSVTDSLNVEKTSSAVNDREVADEIAQEKPTESVKNEEMPGRDQEEDSSPQEYLKAAEKTEEDETASDRAKDERKAAEDSKTMVEGDVEARAEAESPSQKEEKRSSATCDVGQLLADFDLPELGEQRAEVSRGGLDSHLDDIEEENDDDDDDDDNDEKKKGEISLDQALELDLVRKEGENVVEADGNGGRARTQSLMELRNELADELKSSPQSTPSLDREAEQAVSVDKTKTEEKKGRRGKVKLMARSYSKMVCKMIGKPKPIAQLEEEASPSSRSERKRIKSEPDIQIPLFEDEVQSRRPSLGVGDRSAAAAFDWEAASDTGSVSSEASSQFCEGEEMEDEKKKKKKSRRGSLSNPAKGWVKSIAAKFGTPFK